MHTEIEQDGPGDCPKCGRASIHFEAAAIVTVRSAGITRLKDDWRAAYFL